MPLDHNYDLVVGQVRCQKNSRRAIALIEEDFIGYWTVLPGYLIRGVFVAANPGDDDISLKARSDTFGMSKKDILAKYPNSFGV